MNGHEFPKVLVVCPVPLNGQTGGGIAMSGFLKGWPKDRIAQIYTYDSMTPDYSICWDYHRGPAVTTMRFSKKLLFPPIEDLDTAFRALRASRSAFQDGPNPELDAMVEFAQDFDPDVIYCQPLHFPRYYWWLPRYLGAVLDRPIVTHVMDDWPTMIANRDRDEGREHWVEKLNACLNDLFQNSAMNLGISDAMDRGFQERYGKSFEVLQNAIEIDEWTQVHKNYDATNGMFKIMYIGKILPYMQHQSLQDIGKVASRLTVEGTPIDFTIHGPEHLNDKYGQEVFSQPSVHYGGFLPRESFGQSLADADLLVVPVNFDEESLAYVKYSMPAKVPEYMASGTPILVYAPKETPPAEYATKAGWGAVVTERDLDVLEQQITKLIESPSLRQEYGEKARAIAIAQHSFESTRVRFRQILSDATATRTSGRWRDMRDLVDLVITSRRRVEIRSLVSRLPAPVKASIRKLLRRPVVKTVKTERTPAQLERKRQQKILQEVSQEIGAGVAPIIVYEMGRVGSETVFEPLQKAASQPVYHINYMLPDPTKIPMTKGHRVGRSLYELIAQVKRKAKYITLVGDPIGRNTSAFFEPKMRGKDEANDDEPLGELVEQFIKHYSHDTPLKWFDAEVYRSLGIDVFQHPFDIERGYSVVTAGNSEILVLKTELSDDEKSKIVADFVGLPNFAIARPETGDGLSYFQTTILPKLRLPHDYVEGMLSAKYTKHFYSKQEIDDMTRRWVGED